MPPATLATTAFTPPCLLPRRHQGTQTHRSPRMGPDGPVAPPRSTRDRARDFLTQRALQQTMFCSRVLRDETTLRWLEDWLGHHGLDDLHHCDALQVRSDEYLAQTLREPPVVLQIKKPIPGRTSRDNPYMKRRYFTYEVEIVPRKLALRILDARKQIAGELTSDIPCVSAENNRLLELYRSRLISADPTALSKDMLNFPSNGDRAGSPFRSANFDLVKNYTLYLGLRDTCRDLSEHNQHQADAVWLRDFLDTHGKELLAPYAGEFGSADVVIDALLMTSPSIRKGTDGLFDPARLTEQVLRRRAECATVWLEVVKGVEQEQLDLERKLLEETL